MKEQNNSQIKIIFSDFDDTLIQYHGLGRKILRKVLEENNISFDEEAYSKLPRYNIQDKLKIFMPEHFEKVWPEVDKRFSAAVVQESFLFPETKEFLEKVYTKKIPIIIVSTKFERHIKNILKHHNLEKYIVQIIGRETVDPPKPDPKGVLEVLSKYTLKPSDAVFLGDSAMDGENAKNAKVRFIHIKRKEPTEIMPKAWKTITSLTELSSLL